MSTDPVTNDLVTYCTSCQSDVYTGQNALEEKHAAGAHRCANPSLERFVCLGNAIFMVVGTLLL